MSGIVGIFQLDGSPVNHTDINRMLATLAHRGPDGSAAWVEGSLGFGHLMLWTTPESLHEKLPLVSGDGNLIITADARIDNREELFSLLDFSGRAAEEIADSEVILAAYEKWGADCPDKLLGDFAFAIWDKAANTLFCARDHFGLKPFYYYYGEGSFVFASEIKALFSLPGISRQTNELKIATYLSKDLEDNTSTLFQEIKRVPAAYSLSVSPQSPPQMKRYWTLDPTYEVRLDSDEAYARQFREIFTEAVRCRLRSAYPIGSMLSGGMDSSSVTCVARDLMKAAGTAPLSTFSAITPEVPETNESAFIESVVAAGDVKPYYVRADQLSPLYDLNRVVQYVDEIQYAGNFFIAWRISEFAEENGIRILLNGLDGDNTISHGFFYLKELAAQGRWAELASQIEALSKSHEAGPKKATEGYLRRFAFPVLEKLASEHRWLELARAARGVYVHFPASRPLLFRTLRSLLTPGFVRQLNRTLRKIESTPEFPPTINRDFAEQMDLRNYRRSLVNTEPDDAMSEREAHYRRLNRDTLTKAMELTDITGAPFHVESRSPFLDKRLVEFCLALPPNQKLSGGLTRVILRRAMQGILPEKIQWRPRKSILGPNFSYALLKYGRAQIEKLLSEQSDKLARYVDLPYIQGISSRYVSADSISNEDLGTLWSVAMLAVWLNTKDQEKEAPPQAQSH